MEGTRIFLLLSFGLKRVFESRRSTESTQSQELVASSGEKFFPAKELKIQSLLSKSLLPIRCELAGISPAKLVALSLAIV